MYKLSWSKELIKLQVYFNEVVLEVASQLQFELRG